MSRSMKCMQCSSTFVAPSAENAGVTCPRCGATRVVAEKLGGAAQSKTPPVRPPLTDDDVLAFIGAPPAPKAPPKR